MIVGTMRMGTMSKMMRESSQESGLTRGVGQLSVYQGTGLVFALTRRMTRLAPSRRAAECRPD